MIHVYFGDGKGKTTAAAGLAARMAGYGKKVLFMQFLKGGISGEITSLKKLGITVIRCDREYPFVQNMTDAEKLKITNFHNEELRYALSHAEAFNMIVLDEVFSAVEFGLIDNSLLTELVGNIENAELVMTGHNPDKCFIEIADYVTEIKKIKHPFDNGTDARLGVEY